MAAAGVCSSGAGLETVIFPSPIPAEGRLELWVRDLGRQLVSSIVRDVDVTVKALVAHGQVGHGRPPLLQIGWSKSRTGDHRSAIAFDGKGGKVTGGGTIGGGGGASDKSESTGVSNPQSRGGSALMKQNEGTTATAQTRGIPDNGGGSGRKGDIGAGGIPRPCVQGHLLARSVHWTRLVEAALIQGASLPATTNSGGMGSVAVDNPCKTESALQGVHTALLVYLDGWAGELRQPGGMPLYSSITNIALITQALQQRDVVEELLKDFSQSATSMSTTSSDVGGKTTVTAGRAGTAGVTRAQVGDTASTSRASLISSSSFLARGVLSRPGLGLADGVVSVDRFPFAWTCHLRHYHVPATEASLTNYAEERQEGNIKDSESGESGNGEYRRNEEDTGDVPPPPPLLTVGLGTWKVPYGFEYAGTLERLWLTPLSERCLLHAAQSATVS